MQKVTHLIDVEAPCEEVFNTVINIEKRMQLSPLWGIGRLQEVSPNYPEPGSSYHIQVLTGAPFGISQGTLNASQSALAGLAQVLFLKLGATENQTILDDPKKLVLDDAQNRRAGLPVEQQYIIAECQPPCIFSYHLDYDCKTFVTWRFQNIPLGTRINYEEVFCDDSIVGENFIPTVRRVIEEWLTNVKNYSELRGSRWRMFIKWFLDRFYLKLRPDQRRAVQLMLIMQAMALATFVIAAVGWGIARLLF